jgi:hypothetical protein
LGESILSVLRVPFLTALTYILILLSGCGEREPVVIVAPKDVAAVVAPFLRELRAGNKDKAMQYVSPAARDEFAQQYEADQKKLAAAPELTPRFILPQPKLKPNILGAESDSTETSIVYASRKDGKWTSATVRLYRYRDETYVIEYWRITNQAPTPVLRSSQEEEAMKETTPRMMWMMGGLAILSLIGLVVLIWLVKRRPAIISPDIPEERRAAAITVRENGDSE